MTIRLEIKPALNQAAMHLWVFQEHSDGLDVVAPMGMPKWKRLTPTEAAAFDMPEASLVVPWGIWSQLPDAVSTWKTGQDFATRTSAAQAELKATKAHLEDMRTLGLELALRATPGARMRPVRKDIIDQAFRELRAAGFCERGLAAVQDLVKALGGYP